MAKKNSLTWRHGLAFVAVLGGGLYLLRNSKSDEAVTADRATIATVATTSVNTGAATSKNCALRFRLAPDTRVLVFPTENGLNEYVKAAAAADLDAARAARDADGAMSVDPGTRCSLIERSGSDKAKVQILEGEHRNQIAWTTVETTGM
jgi:hypothetical protein